MAGCGARSALRPLVLALAVAKPCVGAEQVATCFQNGMAYDDGKLAPNAGYVSSAEQCQQNCKGNAWCRVFTYRGSTGNTLGGCWNHDATAVLQPQAGAVAGPRECPTVLPTPAPTPAPPVVDPASGALTPAGGFGNASGWAAPAEEAKGSSEMKTSAVAVAKIAAPLALVVLMVVCCCMCNARKDKPSKPPEKKKERRPARPVAPTTSRDSPKSPGAEATPTGSFSEAMPLLRVPGVPGLTPPMLPQPVLPPVQQFGPEPMVPPLDVPMQPLRVPSVSATPSGSGGDASAQAQQHSGSFAGVHSGSSFAGVQSGSFAGVPPGSFVAQVPPSAAFGSFRYA